MVDYAALSYAAQIEVRSDGEAECKDNELRQSAYYLANGTYPEAVNFYATVQVNRELAKASSVCVLSNFQQKDNNGTVVNLSEVILVYDLNVGNFFHGGAKC